MASHPNWYIQHTSAAVASTLAMNTLQGNARVFVLANCMLLAVFISQTCAWLAVLSGTTSLMFWAELCWALVFALNTAANYLCASAMAPWNILIGPVRMSLVIGALYLPWQCGFHLPKLYRDRRKEQRARVSSRKATSTLAKTTWGNVRRAAVHRVPTTKWDAWGGLVGAIWMFSCWGLLPLWHLYLVQTIPNLWGAAGETWEGSRYHGTTHRGTVHGLG